MELRTRHLAGSCRHLSHRRDIAHLPSRVECELYKYHRPVRADRWREKLRAFLVRPSNSATVIRGCCTFIARAPCSAYKDDLISALKTNSFLQSNKNSGTCGCFTYVIQMSNWFDTLTVSKPSAHRFDDRSMSREAGRRVEWRSGSEQKAEIRNRL